MKRGANFIERNKITEMAKSGVDVPEISARLGIAEDVVEAFMPKKPKPKLKPKKDGE